MQLSSLSSLEWNLIAGGLAIFLFGISLMGDALTNFAGPKLRGYVEKYTSNPIKGVFVGIFITGLIQSSSATTVIAISFVRAGIMSLEQAIGITLGANIGTTVTSILIGFDLGYFAYFIALIGVGIFMFSARRKNKYIGEILVGFGLLFIGLEMMGGSLTALKDVPGFEDVVANMAQNPIIAVIIGAALTALIQSSSAFIGIAQSLFASGAIDLNVALALMFGANIGTCITAILASLGGSLSAKRTSLFHILFNVSVSLIFLIFLNPYKILVEHIAGAIGANKLMTIAVGHFTFNFIGMVVFLPLISQTARLLRHIIPGKDSILTDLGNLELDEMLIEKFPAAALDQIRTAIIQESVVALETIKASKEYLNTKDKKYYQTVKEAESMVNDMDTKIQAYLLNFAQNQAPVDIEAELQSYLQVQINVERISDLGENLAEYFNEILESGSSYNEEAVADLNEIYDLVINNIASAVEVFELKDLAKYNKLKEDEAALDLMEVKLRKSHYKRLKQGLDITTMASYVFNDILSTMERIGDHAYNIARLTVEPVKTHTGYHIEGEN
ncbi:Na/Pi cotransporter family protein [Anaerococcus sp. NML200537]|uniref:Na/Pi cotransporter family protein n=1 Tax=Anaerococcus kampingae TaxID=3115614 RepID=A0ABW9MDW4_9FIRM|nr:MULTISPECIES: Na/Pi cotransporter family protein [unclassified Anaerococcus]MCW6701705.1 Na/Pi cotransporter family protein [Anaerococcus sp. NML200537]